MNLSISPVRFTHSNNINFGMAKFSEDGFKTADACRDIYTPLGMPQDYSELENADFYKKVGIFRPPFAKFVRREIKKGNIDKVCDTIDACGSTGSAYANAMFIKQLATCNNDFKKLSNENKSRVARTVEGILSKNWDNPLLSKDETLSLLEMSKDALSRNQYATLVGVIENSDS